MFIKFNHKIFSNLLTLFLQRDKIKSKSCEGRLILIYNYYIFNISHIKNKIVIMLVKINESLSFLVLKFMDISSEFQ